ncbi:UDP-N-acetylmuramate--L-alanine ligase [Psittacicella melopsittaci]|uniref:UDP-N-acetylmuramate--L-alanine ligase n=2 Tax=Psittacicella melopsittaci TaxID=2028576 RepID=A0A3A1Y6X6_9GAMM|nr:UDP-N-acetylmuramate--L-alanine ligase [Psittacicella melopsittaci]RIY33029.1 UDP-N-acetylmuramate--L-alanine ligase [Psittacicella melopsittaci]
MQQRHMPIEGYIHFIGIGGVGMSGIAQVLKNLGYEISGSDIGQNATISKLKNMGITIYPEHKKENIDQAAIIVVSSAIKESNPEIIAAREKGIPIIRRAQMLAEIMRFRHGITVAGTHGKTTTTAMLATVFTAAGLDPTFINGGVVKNAGSNARLGQGKYMIAEADESDASFLHLTPFTSVILNIEKDHMETYQGDFNRMIDTYVNFLHNVPFYGTAVVCYDSPTIHDIIPRIGRKTITYGYSEGSDYQIISYTPGFFSCKFSVLTPEKEVIDLELSASGRHNASNATAALVVALNEGLPLDKIKEGLKAFTGAGRRFDRIGEYQIDEQRKALFIDDYGHHPTELEATINTAREVFPERRLVMLFEPHRYSRTLSLFDDFVLTLSKADQVILLDVYPAGEDPIVGADSQSLSHEIRKLGKDCIAVGQKDLGEILDLILQDNDVVFSQGAGSVSRKVNAALANSGWKKLS